MRKPIIYIPFPFDLLAEFVRRHPDEPGDPAETVAEVFQQYLINTSDDDEARLEVSAREKSKAEDLRFLVGSPDLGIHWGRLFLPNGTWLRMTYKGVHYVAQIQHSAIHLLMGGSSTDEIVAQSPSELVARIASGTNRNAWRDLELRLPQSETWVLADVARHQVKGAA